MSSEHAELISAFEAETYCEQLQTFDIKSIGNHKSVVCPAVGS